MRNCRTKELFWGEKQLIEFRLDLICSMAPSTPITFKTMLSPLGQCEFVSEHLNLIRNVNIVAGCDIIIVTVVIGDMTLAAIYVLFSSLSMDSRQQTEWTKNT